MKKVLIDYIKFLDKCLDFICDCILFSPFALIVAVFYTGVSALIAALVVALPFSIYIYLTYNEPLVLIPGAVLTIPSVLFIIKKIREKLNK